MEEPKKNNQEATAEKRNKYIERAAGIMLLAGAAWILILLISNTRFTKTNNAQVEANIAMVNARIIGSIHQIRFDSYSKVNAGDTLVILDQAEYLIKVAQAEADLDIARANLNVAIQSELTSRSNQEATASKLKGNQANLEKAQKNFERYENMFADSAVTRNQFDQVIAQWKSEQAFLEASEKELMASQSTTKQYEKNIESLQATLHRKEADLDAARLELSYTHILAPIDGIIGERFIQIGELVKSNQNLASIVQSDKIWIIANLKETQLKKIHRGSKVIIRIDALGNRKFDGTVTELSPATGAKFSMIEPDNSTGNFVKITQRVPVKIEFNASPDQLTVVKPGMNATVKIRL